MSQEDELIETMSMYVEDTKDILEEEPLEDDEDFDNFLGMPIENIVYMKRYFKKKGLNPEEDDFIDELLKSETTIEPLKEINSNTYSYNLD